jgi:hypothetical protein
MSHAAKYSAIEPLRDGRQMEIRAFRPEDRQALILAAERRGCRRRRKSRPGRDATPAPRASNLAEASPCSGSDPALVLGQSADQPLARLRRIDQRVDPSAVIPGPERSEGTRNP